MHVPSGLRQLAAEGLGLLRLELPLRIVRERATATRRRGGRVGGALHGAASANG
ncbi:hypothetical protein OG909_23115 [Streptomyces sp. NBC_01754]|uniref:hypothetical protein n=1 Tax=Streptomyces sp. NBC_01754 TaxID=2975930 RepID=UPI002DDB1329|nr:hypothetical protein [Streptomyces sp. NBC_01754]WSC94931.1 hypothetical protein OG909_23115 [Streptomyces sp. NBC_01754]